MEMTNLRSDHARDTLPRRELYLIGRRRSPRVLEYRDFLERNHVPFRWIDVDRNPLVRYLGASAALRQRSLPAFLFPDGSSIEAAPGQDGDSRSRERRPRSRRGRGCTSGRTRSATTSSSSARAGRADRGRVRRVRGAADARRGAARAGRPGRDEQPDRELPRLPARDQRQGARRVVARPGASGSAPRS